MQEPRVWYHACTREDLKIINVSKRRLYRCLLRIDLREWNWGEFPALQPMDSRSVDSSCLLGADVGTILQVRVLSLLLGLEVKTSETTEVFLHNCFVDGGATTNTLTVVVGNAELRAVLC